MKHNLETGEAASLKCEPRDDRLDIARRLYRAMCAQYPDRLITLCDGGGGILEKTSSARPSLLAVERN
jgi:hypothetical protein